MTTLTGRQQLELSMLCLDVQDYPTEKVWDRDRNCYAARYLAAQVALVNYVRTEGIDPGDFDDRLRHELREAHLAASMVKWAPDGYPLGSLAGQILTAAGVPFVVEKDDEGDGGGGAPVVTKRRLTLAQRAEVARLDRLISEHLGRMPPSPTTADGSLILSHEHCDTAEHRAATARYVELTADALRYLVAEDLTHSDYAQEMVGFVFAGGTYWIWQSRAEHLAEAEETFGAAVLKAAGFEPDAAAA